jgi:hypothetical protein
MGSYVIPIPLVGEATPVTSYRELVRQIKYMSSDDAIAHHGLVIQRVYHGYRLVDRHGTIHTYTGKSIATQQTRLLNHLNQIISGQ